MCFLTHVSGMIQLFLVLLGLSQLVVARYDEATWHALQSGGAVMGDVGTVLNQDCWEGMAEGGDAAPFDRIMSLDDTYNNIYV